MNMRLSPVVLGLLISHGVSDLTALQTEEALNASLQEVMTPIAHAIDFAATEAAARLL